MIGEFLRRGGDAVEAVREAASACDGEGVYCEAACGGCRINKGDEVMR